MKTTNEYLTKIRQFKQQFAEKYGIISIGIFGSVARGEQHEESDLDVFVELKDPDPFIMFDINDTDVSYYNKAIKTQTLIVMCLVHEDDLDTEYGIVRTDLLSYIVKDLLCWTNVLGKQLKCTDDYGDIIDSRYYCRTLKFEIECPNNLYAGMNNRYDNFQGI